MEYVPRLIETQITDYLSTAPRSTLLVTGPPQVGKTRLIEHAIESAKPKRISFSLAIHSHFRAQIDACANFNQFRKLLENEYRFDSSKGTILFIDDIQESPALADFIPRMSDAWSGCPIILCGSLLPGEFENVFSEPSQSISHISIHPYQFSEFLKANQKGSLSRHVERGKTAIFEDRHNRLLEWLERFLEVGGLPEVVDWASHGEDFSFHLDEIINEIGGRLTSSQSIPDMTTANDALRSLAEDPTREIPTSVMEALERWGLARNLKDVSEYYALFDLGIARQYRLTEPVSFWDAESGDADALLQLTQVIKHQTALSLQYQNVKFAPLGDLEADFAIETHGATVPITCTPLFSLDPVVTENVFSMMNAAESEVGVIACLTPFEAVERDGKRLLSVPLYLMEALLGIISHPA